MAWARVVVCGLGLCPFAEGVLDSNTVRVFVSDATDETSVKNAVADEISLLLSTRPELLSTSLLVLPRFAEKDFLRFHVLCGELEGRIEGEERLVDEVMLACFHPLHQWGDSRDEDDAINFDKRAPYPIVNFLRAPVVDQYVREGKTQHILEHNQSTLEHLGKDKLKELYRSLVQEEKAE